MSIFRQNYYDVNYPKYSVSKQSSGMISEIISTRKSEYIDIMKQRAKSIHVLIEDFWMFPITNLPEEFLYNCIKRANTFNNSCTRFCTYKPIKCVSKRWNMLFEKYKKKTIKFYFRFRFVKESIDTFPGHPIKDLELDKILREEYMPLTIDYFKKLMCNNIHYIYISFRGMRFIKFPELFTDMTSVEDISTYLKENVSSESKQLNEKAEREIIDKMTKRKKIRNNYDKKTQYYSRKNRR